MAFIDRIVDYPGRVRLTPVSGQSNVYDMTREEGEVYEPGTLLNANNLNNPDVTSLKIGGEEFADWVIEQGTNGSWKYRKWHSGKVEAWARWNVGDVACTIAASTFGGYRSGSLSFAIPSGIFTAAPFAVGIKSYSQGAWLVSLMAASSTSISALFGCSVSTTVRNQTIDIYAWQN